MGKAQFSLHFDPVGDVLAAAERCEAAVFLETYGNTAQQWRAEYGPYDASSAFIAILGTDGEAVASSRLILPSAVGLKSLVDTESAPWSIDANQAATAAGMSPAQTWDIATIAVRRGTAGAGVLAAALYHGIVAATRANRLRWVVMIIDARARRLLGMLNLEGLVLPGTSAAPYLGSAVSIPLWADVPRLMETQRERNPDGFRMIDAGVGLEAIAMPDPADFLIRARGLLPPIDFVPRHHGRDGVEPLAAPVVKSAA